MLRIKRAIDSFSFHEHETERMHEREVCDALYDATLLLQRTVSFIFAIGECERFDILEQYQLYIEAHGIITSLSELFVRVIHFPRFGSDLVHQVNHFNDLLFNLIVIASEQSFQWQAYRRILCASVLQYTLEFKDNIERKYDYFERL